MLGPVPDKGWEYQGVPVKEENDMSEAMTAAARLREYKQGLSAAASERERIAREEREAVRAELNGWMLSVAEDHVRQRVLAILDSRDKETP